MTESNQKSKALNCIRLLVRGICNQPDRLSIRIHTENGFPRLGATPCPDDYAILHGRDGRQTKAFMALSQRAGVQYELIDGHGVEDAHVEEMDSKQPDLAVGLELINDMCVILFGSARKLRVQHIVSDKDQRKEIKVRVDVDRNNSSEMANVSLIADLLFPWSWNQLKTVIKVRANQKRVVKAV